MRLLGSVKSAPGSLGAETKRRTWLSWRGASFSLLAMAIAGMAGFLVVTAVRSRTVSNIVAPDPAAASFAGGPWSVQDARTFDQFAVYWLGDSFDGLPLTAVLRDVRPSDPSLPYPTQKNGVIFIYGDCEPHGDGGCAPPVSIRVEPLCDMPPELFAPRLGRSGLASVRGASEEKVGDHLRIWTGDSAITIYAPDDVASRAATALAVVNTASFAGDARMDGSLAPMTLAACRTIQGVPAKQLLPR